MIDTNAGGTEDHHADQKTQREIDRQDARLLLAESGYAKSGGGNQEEQENRIDFHRFRKQVERRLQSIRKRAATRGASAEYSEDAAAAGDVHGDQYDDISNACADRELDRCAITLREGPTQDDGDNAEDGSQLGSERQREEERRQIERTAFYAGLKAKQEPAQIQHGSERIALGSEQRLLRGGRCENRRDSCDAQQK